MSGEREWSPERYRELAAYVRGRARDYRHANGQPNIDMLNATRAGVARFVARHVPKLRTAKEIKRLIADCPELGCSDDDLVEILLASDAKRADEYEATAAALEAEQRANVIPLDTKLRRQQRHIADAVAKADAKREVAAATCSDDNLESNLRASLGAHTNDSPPNGAA